MSEARERYELAHDLRAEMRPFSGLVLSIGQDSSKMKIAKIHNTSTHNYEHTNQLPELFGAFADNC